MSTHSHSSEPAPNGLAGFWHRLAIHPERIFWVLVGLCVFLIVFDFLYHNFSGHTKHGHFSFETIVGFHAAYGFGAFAFVVMVGSKLRGVLMRPEGYYDVPRDEPPDDGHDHGHGHGHDEQEHSEGGHH